MAKDDFFDTSLLDESEARVGGSPPAQEGSSLSRRSIIWGNKWDASRCANNRHETESVGSYPQGISPYGVLDMAGNTWEWCADWYKKDYYKTASSNNPQGPATGDDRVLRGGS